MRRLTALQRGPKTGQDAQRTTRPLRRHHRATSRLGYGRRKCILQSRKLVATQTTLLDLKQRISNRSESLCEENLPELALLAPLVYVGAGCPKNHCFRRSLVNCGPVLQKMVKYGKMRFLSLLLRFRSMNIITGCFALVAIRSLFTPNGDASGNQAGNCNNGSKGRRHAMSMSMYTPP